MVINYEFCSKWGELCQEFKWSCKVTRFRTNEINFDVIHHQHRLIAADSSQPVFVFFFSHQPRFVFSLDHRCRSNFIQLLISRNSFLMVKLTVNIDLWLFSTRWENISNKSEVAGRLDAKFHYFEVRLMEVWRIMLLITKFYFFKKYWIWTLLKKIRPRIQGFEPNFL